MSDRKKDKILKKIVEDLEFEVEKINGDLKHLNNYFKTIFGNEPEVLNMHFLLKLLQQGHETIQHADYEIKILRKFIEEKKLDDEFKTWVEEFIKKQNDEVKKQKDKKEKLLADRERERKALELKEKEEKV